MPVENQITTLSVVKIATKFSAWTKFKKNIQKFFFIVKKTF